MGSRRAVGSLIGIGFLLMILAIGFSYYNVVTRVEDTTRETITQMQEQDLNAADEEMEIQNVELTVGNSLNLTIKNTGNVFTELIWIGVIDETLNTQDYYRVDTGINPIEIQKDIGNSSIVINPANTYTIQVLTKLGNIFYAEYPEPSDEVQFFYVDYTADTYSPTESGTHSLFAAMQAGPDDIEDTLSEAQLAFTGEITDVVSDTFEFDTGTGNAPDIVHVSGDVYAIAYQSGGSDGWLATVEIDSTGQITDPVIDSWEFTGATGVTPDIEHVSGDIYAIAYQGGGSDGFIDTVEIGTDGTITTSIIDSLEYDTGRGVTPSLVHVSGDYYAIAYSGPGTDGWVATVEIDTLGAITNSVVDTLEFDTADCVTPYMMHISGDYYAIVYTGTAADGFLVTVEIDTAGLISNTVTDSWEFDATEGNAPHINLVSGDIYSIVYDGSGGDGTLVTLDISTTGVITQTIIDSFVFIAADGNTPVIEPIQGDYFAIVYSGAGADGFVITVEIDTAGTITNSVLDTLEYDATRGVAPMIFALNSDYHGAVYSGGGSDGFVTTWQYVGAYSLDLEVSWTGLPSMDNEYLTIYAGTLGAETISVDYWDGGTWVNIIASLSAGYNTIDVSAYLTGSSFTIRFIDAVQLGDTGQDTWEIDVAYLNLFD